MPSNTNIEVIDPAVESAFRQMLKKYWEIEAMKAAWAEFSAEDNWEEEKVKIQAFWASQNPPGPVLEYINQATAWIGPLEGVRPQTPNVEDQVGTYWYYQYTNFKALGLITGINPRFYPEYQYQSPDWESREFWDTLSGRNNFEWDQDEKDARTLPAVEGPTSLGTTSIAMNVGTVTDIEQVSSGGNPAIFLSPGILKYALVKFKSAAATNSAAAPWYFALYTALLNLWKEFNDTSPSQYRSHPLASATNGMSNRQILDGSPSAGPVPAILAAATAATLEQVLGLDTTNPAPPSTTVIYGAPYGSSGQATQRESESTNFRGESLTGFAYTGENDIDIVTSNLKTVTQERHLMVPFALGEDGDDDEAKQKAWILKAVTRESTALEAVNDAIVNLIIHVAAKPASEGGWDMFAGDYKFDRKHARLSMIRGFFGSDVPPENIGENLNAENLQKEGALQRLQAPKRNLTPIDFQCYLLEQIRKLAAGHPTDYKNIVKLDSNKQPGLVKTVLSQKYSLDEAKALLNLCPDVQALLVPYLKVWRVDYDKNNKAFREVPLKIPNFMTPGDTQTILQRGRQPGAGIKSFNWSLDGVQPAEVDNNISATLDMYFQSVADFFNNKTKVGQADEASFLDLVIASPGKKSSEATPGVDPSTEPPSMCSSKLTNDLARQYEGERYRIKITAGWATPGPKVRLPPQLRSALDKARITLFLQQTRHEFRFNENGSLNLSIDYQAALSGMALSPRANILDGTPEKAAEEFKAMAEKAKVLKERADEQDTEAAREEYKAANEAIIQKKSTEKLRKYKKFLKKLFESDKIYNMYLDPDELILPPYSELSAEGRARRAKRRSAATTSLFGSVSQNTALLDAVTEAEATGTSNAGEAAAASSKSLQDFYKGQIGSSDSIWISFFYLGDLLDMVLEQIKENNEVADIPFSFFLSDVEMIDPLTALQISGLEEIIKCGQDLTNADFLATLVAADPNTFSKEFGVHQLMNIGDIPISIDAFQVFFKDYVVKKDIDTYYFLHFVKDLCGDLITRALASKCFGAGVKFTQRFDAQPISYNRQDGETELKPNKTVLAGSPNIQPGAPYSLSRSIRALDETTAPQNVGLGLVLLGTDSKPKGLLGSKSRETDIEKGVYHHYLGAACGLVKKVTFNREDQPYLREAKIQKEGSFSAAQLRELYSAQLELYGNTMYKNGNYVYINPSFIGAPEREVNILGLHGYYLITGVDSTVTENSFNVGVSVLHEGIAFTDPLLVSPDSLAIAQEEWRGLPPEAGPTYEAPPSSAPIGTVFATGEDRDAADATGERASIRAQRAALVRERKAILDAEYGKNSQQFADWLDSDPTLLSLTEQMNKIDAANPIEAPTIDISTPAE